jgi:hypothetical protein
MFIEAQREVRARTMHRMFAKGMLQQGCDHQKKYSNI